LGEAAGCVAIHVQFPGDPAYAQAAGHQGLDGGMLVTHPCLQPRFGCGKCDGGRVCSGLGILGPGGCGDLLEAGPVAGDGLDCVLGEVVPQMRAIRDLHCGRRRRRRPQRRRPPGKLADADRAALARITARCEEPKPLPGQWRWRSESVHVLRLSNEIESSPRLRLAIRIRYLRGD